ncbi:MAG: hypothetical protein KDB68_09335 [Planctomycetes bacterium]|nr:hypothetical protein [Planctomycetota bacterium]MCA8936400.1 hypothetical protein [Planctomycetota bacterium]MCA8947702.1 hypothetical protein [Planctomycetota bacterium]
MSEPRKIHEAEIVKDSESQNGEAAGSHLVERVEVRRIPGGAFFGRSAFQFNGDPAEARKRLREVKLRLWLWLLGLASISAGCFYGAWAIDSKFMGAFLIFAGAVISVAAGVVWLMIWALRRLPQL